MNLEGLVVVLLNWTWGNGLTFKSSFGLDRSDIEGTFFRPAGLGFYNNLPPGTSAGSLDNRRTVQLAFGKYPII